MIFLFAAAFESWLPTSLPKAVKGKFRKKFALAHCLSAHQLPSYKVYSVCFVPVMTVKY